MKTKKLCTICLHCTALVCLSVSPAFAQVERWIYVYDGPQCITAGANAITCSPDGDIYAAGYCSTPDSMDDMLTLRLTPNGDTSWTYRYNSPENRDDALYAIIFGADSNIYAAGHCCEPGGLADNFAIISLTNEGAERWIYRYNHPNSVFGSVAKSMVFGTDGNIYAAGYLQCDGEPFVDFLVISLTSAGVERWVYRYNGPDNYNDVAYSLDYGNNEIFVTGYSENYGYVTTLIVACLDTAGTEQWVYSHNTTPDWPAKGRSVVFGPDNNVYVAGLCDNPLDSRDSYSDFVVISLTENGDSNWSYIYTAQQWYSWDEAQSLVYGTDSNIYACGFGSYVNTNEDALVISLTNTGSERWVYAYDGPSIGGGMDKANSIVYGLDNNIYVAGYETDTVGLHYDFLTIGLSSDGSVLWVYSYDGPGGGYDEATSIAYGADSNLYVAGYCNLTSTLNGFTVISLNPAVGINEYATDRVSGDLQICSNPFRDRVDIRWSIIDRSNVNLLIHDIAGRVVKDLSPVPHALHTTDLSWDGTDDAGDQLPSGVYFLKLTAGDYTATEKLLLIK